MEELIEHHKERIAFHQDQIKFHEHQIENLHEKYESKRVPRAEFNIKKKKIKVKIGKI